MIPSTYLLYHDPTEYKIGYVTQNYIPEILLTVKALFKKRDIMIIFCSYL